MDNSTSTNAATAPAATAPAKSQAKAKAVEHLSYLGLGAASWVAAGAAAIRRSQRQQMVVGLLFVLGLAWVVGSVAYHHVAKTFISPVAEAPATVATAPAMAPATQTPEPQIIRVPVPTPEPQIIRVPVPMEAPKPDVCPALVLFEDGWVWDTPIGIQVGGTTYKIPESQKSRFNVSEAEEIPLPASLRNWAEMSKEESEGLKPVKVYLVG